MLAPAGRVLGAEGAPWYATMRRCGQLNFNERDPLTLDVEAWADYWASLKVDAVLLGGGGIVAFYPTEVPHHHRSEFLGARDLFGGLAAAHALARMPVEVMVVDAQNRRIIHASSSHGVTEANLADKWFQARYLGARRVVR